MAKKIIIDVDTGVDDAQAIMLALSSKEVDVVAITCVQGNVDVDNVCQNTLRVLKVCDRLDIPVFRGADKPLIGIGPDATHFHGNDGMGDVTNPDEVDMSLIQSEPASIALLRLTNQYPGEITLVALAPLTNIALAIRLDPNFGSRLKEMVLMGGNIEGKGNTNPHIAAEFNFCSDPEAAFVTLNELGCPILNLSWETCTKTGMSMEWFLTWLNMDTNKGRFNKAINRICLPILLKEIEEQGYISCDLLTMAVAIDRSVAMETVCKYVTVELSGTYSRGQMIVDWRDIMQKCPNVKVMMSYDMEKTKTMFMQAVS